MAREEQPAEPVDTERRSGEKDGEPLGRSDFVLAKALTVLVTVIGPMLILQHRIRAWIAGDPLVWRSDGPAGPAFEGADPVSGVEVRHSGELVWEWTEAGPGRWLIALLPDLLSATILAAVGVLVLKLLRRVDRGEPFQGAAAAHVRAVGTLIFCYGLLMPLATLAAGAALTFPAQEEPSFGFVIGWGSFTAIAAGLVVLVLSEAWRRGERLDHDLRGLV